MITINNMSMPKNCEDCRCTFNGFDGSTECILGAKRIDWSKRPKDCPLVEPERPQGECEKCPFKHTEKCDICINRIRNMQSASDRPQGEWITTTARTYCSNCDYYEYNSKAQELLRKFNYCPNCGADMRPKKKLQTPSCLTNPERQAELLERYKEE